MSDVAHDERSKKSAPEKLELEKSRYLPGKFVGKSLVRLKQNERGDLESIPQGDLYDRWSQAVASCKELGEMACTFGFKQRFRIRSFLMPVVVVPDGVLYKAEYEPSAVLSRDPEPVNECEFFVAAKLNIKTSNFEDVSLSHIHFVTIQGFRELLMGFVKGRPAGGTTWGSIFG